MNITVQTHIGNVREHNEDRYYFHTPRGGEVASPSLIVVADGMGGHSAGEVASQMAVDVFRAWMENPDSRPQLELPVDEPEAFPILRHLVAQANRQIYDASCQDLDRTGMGTTLIAGWIQEEVLYFAHVGDSRLYLFREGALRQLTTDHSFVQELVAKGKLTPDAAKSHPRRYIISRAVGLDPTVQVDLGEFPLQQGDLLLACTDGLTDMVDDEAISSILIDLADELELACGALIEEALACGGEDNVTVMLSDFSAMN